MKKILATLTACLTMSLGLCAAHAQQAGQGAAAGRAAAAEESTGPHKIGLIDMARVFKEYKKFEDLRDKLKAEYDAVQSGGQGKAQQMQKLQEEMKQFEQGSQEYTDREQQLVKMNAELQAFGRSAQRDLMRKESELFRDVYDDALAAVKLYAEYFNFTLVLRFDSSGFDSDDPQQVLETLNQQVVYHRNGDDITMKIIKYLNGQYESQQKAAPQTARPGGATSTR